MIDVAKISFTKTFVEGYLEGIVIDNEYFFVPLSQRYEHAANMEAQARSGVILGITSRYTVSNIQVEV